MINLILCIIQNTTFNENFGISTYLRNIIKSLGDQKNLEIYAIVQKQSRAYKNDFSKRIKIFEIEGDSYTLSGNIQFILGALPLLKMLIDEKGIQILHAIYPFSSLLAIYLSFFSSRSAIKPLVIYDLRSPWPETGLSRKKMTEFIRKIVLIIIYGIESLLVKRIDGVIFITERLKNSYHLKMQFPEKETVIPSGFDNNAFVYMKNTNKQLLKEYVLPTDKVFGYLGAINRPRELNFVIKAFKKLKSQINNVKLIFVGDGTDFANLIRLRDDLKLEGSVFFLGSVESHKAPYYIGSFDVCICHLPPNPMFKDSFPLKVLEYLACGRIVLATNIIPHRSIIKPRVNGYLYHPYSIEDFVDSGVKCLQTDNETKRRNISMAISNYSWNNLAVKTVRFYSDILD